MALQSKHTSKGKGNCALFMSTNKKKNQPCISANYLVQVIERVCTIQPSYVCDTMAKEVFFFYTFSPITYFLWVYLCVLCTIIYSGIFSDLKKITGLIPPVQTQLDKHQTH